MPAQLRRVKYKKRNRKAKRAWPLNTSHVPPPPRGFDKLILDGSTAINPGRRIKPWTDDYSNLFQVLR